MDNSALKKIQHFLKDIEQPSDNVNIVNTIADYIFSHQELLSDDDITLELINALSDWLHGKSETMSDVYTALYFFWLAGIIKAKIDVYYIGDLDQLQHLASRFPPPAISNIFFLPGAEERADEITNYLSKIDNSIAPFVIFDPSGLKIAMKVANPRVISTVSLYDLLNVSAIPTSDVANQFALYLSRQYRLLENPRIKTVIIGNSYGFYGFPETVLEQSVNISKHSLGIKQFQQLTEHILTKYPHIENFIFCLGIFELYIDLYKSNDRFNRSVINAFSQLSCHYNINYTSDSAIDGALVFSRVAMPTPSQTIISELDDMDRMSDIYNSAVPLLSSTDSMVPAQQDMTATQRAIAHSNSVKHKTTFEENTVRAAKIAGSIDEAGKKHIWLTPPFPAAYVDNLDAEMVRSHRQFFAKYSGGRAKCIDLSEDRQYTGKDFRDGDHLNFSGASKLIARLRELNIPL